MNKPAPLADALTSFHAQQAVPAACELHTVTLDLAVRIDAGTADAAAVELFLAIMDDAHGADSTGWLRHYDLTAK